MSISKKTKVVSFISGKGGVGKTTLTVAVGKLLSLIRYKVLLIDSDLTTHGMTFLLGFNPKRPGILEFYNTIKGSFRRFPKSGRKELIKRLICKLSPNLHFIQSTSRPSHKYSEQVFSEREKINAFLEEIFSQIPTIAEYDFVVIDSQAGSVPTTFSVVSCSSNVVIVMEPDPISTYATENVAGELSAYLPRESFYVINKLSVEEASGYIAIERYLKILRHLPPIPFDFEVRRRFMTRQIPIDKSKPSAFMFGITRMVKDLLPEIAEKISKIEEETQKVALAPTEKKLEALETETLKLVEMKANLSNMLNRLRSKRERYRALRSTTLAILSLASVVLAISSFYFEPIFATLPYALIVTVVTFGYAFGMILYFEYKKKPVEIESRELQKQIAVIEEKMDSLRRESDAYRNLLITQSRELLLKTEEK